MPLAAAQVVNAIATRITGLSLAGVRVYTDRAWPLAEDALPAWKVVAVDEDVDPQTIHAPVLEQHALQIELQGYAKAVAGLDDALHALASEALTALFNAPGLPDALSGLTSTIITTRRIERAMQKEGEAVLGLVTITLRGEFRTLSNAPDTIL